MGRDNSHKTNIDFINFMLCIYMYLMIIKKILQKLYSSVSVFAKLEMLEYFIIFLIQCIWLSVRGPLAHRCNRKEAIMTVVKTPDRDLNLSTLNHVRVRCSSH